MTIIKTYSLIRKCSVLLPRFYQERTEDSERKESNEYPKILSWPSCILLLLPRFYQERTEDSERKESNEYPKILPWPSCIIGTIVEIYSNDTCEGRGSGGKNVIFSTSPNSIFEYSNLL